MARSWFNSLTLVFRFAVLTALSLFASSRTIADAIPPPDVSDVDVLFTQDQSVYRINLKEALASLTRQTLIGREFFGSHIRRRPDHPGQFAYAKQRGLIAMDRCGGIIVDHTREGTGSRFWDDFRWSNSGESIVFGVYGGTFNSSPDLGVNRLDISSATSVRVVRTSGFTYDHSPAYSPSQDRLAYVHHEYRVQNWLAVVPAKGGEREIWLRLPNSFTDEDLSLAWVDDSNILGLNRREEALILVNTSNGGSFTTFPIEGSAAQLSISPNRKRFAVRAPFRGPVRILHGEVGNWGSREEISFDGEVVENLVWIDDDRLIAYTRERIVLVDLRNGNVHDVADARISSTYGIEVLEPCPQAEILSNVVDGAGQAARCSISSPSLNFFPSKTWTISSEPLSLRQRTSA